jgi:hypothetical protein
MLEIKPNQEIWSRVNAAILDENAAVALITIVSGMCALLVESGVCKDERQARAHLAAVLLSPDDAPNPGSLLPMLKAELDRLNDGTWIV